jgi:hypothetical protein
LLGALYFVISFCEPHVYRGFESRKDNNEKWRDSNKKWKDKNEKRKNFLKAVMPNSAIAEEASPAVST